MFNVVYRWRVHPAKEAQFEEAWSALTARIRDEKNGLGSRLHRCSDGSYVAYAEWPDRETWVRSQATPFAECAETRALAESIASREPDLELEPVNDLLIRSTWRHTAIDLRDTRS